MHRGGHKRTEGINYPGLLWHHTGKARKRRQPEMTVKTAKQTRDELMEHWKCSLKVDFGSDEAGIWCQDCKTAIGIYSMR